MTPFRRIVSDYREAGSLEALLQLDSLVDRRTVLTRTGDLLTVLKAKPRDAECLDAAQLDAVSRHFEGTLRSVNESFRLRQYALKRPFAGVSPQAHSNPVVNELLAARANDLNARASRLFALDVYFVVAYTGWRPEEGWSRRLSRWASGPRRALGAALSRRAAVAALENTLEQAREHLAQTVDSVVVQLQEAVPVTVLETDDVFRFFRRLLNYDPAKSEYGSLKYANGLAYQAADSALECYRDHLRLDDTYVQVLSLKEPPEKTFAHILRGLYDIPSNFVIATDWMRQDHARMRRLINSKRRHHFNTKVSLMSHLNSTPVSAKDSLIDTGAAAHVDALGTCLEEIDVNGRHFGEFGLTVVLYDRDFATLKRSVAEAFKIFAAYDTRMIEERYNALNAWLASIPGNESYNVRRLWLLNTHYADLSFLFAPECGDPVNRHLKREHLAVLESENGTPFYFNLHVQDVAHTLVLGATGSGKSFLLNFLVSFLQRYDPRTLIFDLGGSYRALTRRFGGAYVPIAGTTDSFKINPFCLPATPEHLHFLAAFVHVLIDSSGCALSAEDETDLVQQIDSLYAIDPGPAPALDARTHRQAQPARPAREMGRRWPVRSLVRQRR